jgi:predicted nucleotide-binding protein
MATMKKKSEVIYAQPRLNPATAISLLQKQIERAKQLRGQPGLSASEYEAWRTTLHDLLQQALGKPNETVDSIISAGNCYAGSFGGGDDQDEDQERRQRLGELIHYLDSAIEQLNIRLSTHPQTAPSTTAALKNAVFLVHGHAEMIREKTARFIESKLGLKALILAEENSGGDTVIEKLERYAAEVDYAVVLLTADDRGGKKDSAPESYEFRSRQNVIFELGFFIAKLGRERVFLLYEKGVERPSDIAGVVYAEIDPGDSWQLRLAKELKGIGMSIDMNRL